MKLKTLVYLSLITLVTSLGSAADAQTFSVIHTFTGNGGDGAYPNSGVTLKAGTLYGTTYNGGLEAGNGSAYQLTRVGSDWVYTPIFLFPNDGSGGAYPEARVVFGPDGHLYGTTHWGGLSNYGVVFRLTPPLSICKTANCFWTENVLHRFLGFPVGDGANPSNGDLTWDAQGNLYGTTTLGGSSGSGTVFQMNPGTNTYSVIYRFPAYYYQDGAYPYAGVTLDQDGNLLGTTYRGGRPPGFVGTIFKLTDGGGTWRDTILVTFYEIEHFGLSPIAGVTRTSAGILYAATSSGEGPGDAPSILVSADEFSWYLFWTFTTTPTCYDPPGPRANVTVDKAGNVYGTTYCNGAFGSYGNVFAVTSKGYVSLHEFTGGSDGAYPMSNVTIDDDGTLYGTTSSGGDTNGCNCGVVWMIKP